MTLTGQNPRLRRFATTMAVAAAVLALCAPTTRSLAHLWLDTAQTTYTHGFLVAMLCTWLLWRSAPPARTRLSMMPAWLVAGALLLAALLWAFCLLAGIQIGGMLLLPVLLWGAAFLVQGANTARAAIFPLAFLYFAIPIWDFVNGVAQEITVTIVRLLLRITDVPAFVSGNFVQIRSGIFEIAGGCSGLHFIIVALAFGALLGELRGDGWLRRVGWLATALMLALLTNWVRVYTIILAGHLTDMQHYIVRVSHYGYGWALFAIALLILFVLERRAPPPAATPPAVETALPLSRRAVAGAVLALCIVALPWVLIRIIDARLPGGAEFARRTALPPAPPGWHSATGSSEWQPVLVGADRIERQRFRRDDLQVELLVAWYRKLAQGHELAGYENRPGGDAEVLDDMPRSVAGRTVVEQQLGGADGESVLWIEYRVDGRRFSSAMRAQLWYGWLTLRGLRSPTSQVRLLHAPCAPGCDAARAGLEAFLGSLGDSA